MKDFGKYAPYISDADSGYKKKQPSDVHHQLPRSRGGSNDSKNLVEMHVQRHRALHSLLGTLTPIEQQLFLALKINDGSLTQRFKSELADLLLEEQNNPDWYYKNGVYTPKGKKKI